MARIGRNNAGKSAQSALKATRCALAAMLAASLATGLMACSATSSNSGNSNQQTTSSQTQGAADQQATPLTCNISKHPKFDAAMLELTADDFAQAGLEFGDSCDVSFSNGYTLTDIPYYNGYYVNCGDPVICAYPSEDYVVIANNNAEFWTPAKLDDSCTTTITLNTKGKYLDTYKALSQSYTNDRADYSSDEQFANFRALSGGKLKENFLYRGASPIDNSRNRASYASKLIERAGVKTVIDLADTAQEVSEYMAADDFNSPYFEKLYKKGKVATLSMSSDHDSAGYKQGMAKALRHLLKNGGPAYIHCTEGKDRTGYICLLIEALAGASYDEMLDDYMLTYANYYGITKEQEPERYAAVEGLYFRDFMTHLSGMEDADEDKLRAIDYSEYAKSYLESCGLSDKEIAQLEELIER